MLRLRTWLLQWVFKASGDAFFILACTPTLRRHSSCSIISLSSAFEYIYFVLSQAYLCLKILKRKYTLYTGIESFDSWRQNSAFRRQVRGTVFPRELGPGGTVFPKGIRSAGPKIGPDRIPYDTGSGREPMFPQSSRWTFVHYSYKVVA